MGKSLPTFHLPGLRAHRRHGAMLACACLFALCGVGPASASASRQSTGSGHNRNAKPALQRRTMRPRVAASIPSAQSASIPGKPIVGRLFAPNSVWNQPVPPNAPLDPASARLVAHFASEAEAEGRAGTGPFVETYELLDADLRRRSVSAHRPSGDRHRPEQPSGSGPCRAHRTRYRFRPTPDPAEGTDAQITIYQPSTDRLWEYWDFAAGARRLARPLGRRDR